MPLKHRKLGNVDLRLGLFMVLGSIPGVETAKRLLLYLETRGLEDEVIHYVYVVVLGALGMFLLYDWVRSGRKQRVGDVGPPGPFVMRVRNFSLRPTVSLPVAGIPRISIWVLVFLGFSIGLFAGLLGAGGGFLLMPALVFLLGIPTITAVGTDLFQVMITGSFGALTYALDNKVDLLMALVMLGAASIGSQLGTRSNQGGGRFAHTFSVCPDCNGRKRFAGVGPGIGSSRKCALSLDCEWQFSSLGAAGAMCGVIAVLVVASRVRGGSEGAVVGSHAGPS